ncbi:branched-chain amino acid transaminase [bacterium]|nr:branched-chain amino acid transaminase [bacterium]
MSQDSSEISYVWLNGKMLRYGEAKVSVLTHTLHYGTGAFEGIRAYQTTDGRTAIFRATEHYKRLYDSCKALALELDPSIDWIAASKEIIQKNGFKECYLRPLAYVGDQLRGLKMPAGTKAEVALIAWPWGKYMGDEGASKGIRVGVSSYRRPDVSTGLPWAKLTGGYLNSALARRQASLNGLDEAILLDMQGYVAEGSGENIFMVKNGVLYTPPQGAILPGITRDSVMQLARAMKIQVVEQAITRNQLYLADELFFTGTAVEVCPIREVDGHSIGTGRPGEITKMITDQFFKAVRGENAAFSQWLTYV